MAGGSFEAHNNNTEAFDEFDPRGPVSGTELSVHCLLVNYEYAINHLLG